MGRSNIWIIFNLSKGKHLCGVSIPAGDILVWRCVLVMYCWNVFKPFNVIQIQSNFNSLISKSINHSCASASRQLWQSHSLTCEFIKYVTVSVQFFCFSCRRNPCCPQGGPVYFLYCSNEPQCWGQSKNSNVCRDQQAAAWTHYITFSELYSDIETSLLD